MLACGEAAVRPGDGTNKTTPGTGGATIQPPGNTGGAGGGIGIAPPSADAGGGEVPASQPPMEACAADKQTAKLSPVDLVLLVDASGSMAEKAGMRSRWELARDALVSFLGDQRSRGFGVGLQLFPLHTETCTDDGTCFLPSPGGCRVFSACLAPGAAVGSGKQCDGPGDDPCPAGTTCTPLGRCSVSGGDCVGMGTMCKSGVANDVCGTRPRQCRIGPRARGSCVVGDYQKLTVPIAELPGESARLTGALDTRLPIGGTPLGPALRGAIAYITARQQSHPDRKVALAVITDGVPEGCGDVASILADLTASRMLPTPISTYFVGVFADTDPPAVRTTMQQFAMAGGTNTAFIVSANEQLGDKFLTALNEIRGASLPCDLAIPKPATGQIDYAKVNVHVDGAGGPKDLVYVERVERCTAAAANPDTVGWYYDVHPTAGTPARVQLCPAACGRLKSDPTASIELRFGCRSLTID